MGVYSSGSVNVKVNSATVWGNNTLFSTYTSAGDIFHLSSEATFYSIAAINSATNLSLSSVYANSGYSDSTELNSRSYQIVSDFTTYYSIPEMDLNDKNLQHIFTRAVQTIDTAIFKRNSRTVSANYTASGNDQTIIANASLNITLPAASSSSKGVTLRIISNTASRVGATCTGSVKIGGSKNNGATHISTYLTTKYQTLTLEVATTNLWVVIR